MLAVRSLLRTNTLACATAGLSSGLAPSRGKHTLPELPYGYKDLEPTISGEIMELHHKKHHATYVNNLNAAEEQLQQAMEKGKVAPCQLMPSGQSSMLLYPCPSPRRCIGDDCSPGGHEI